MRAFLAKLWQEFRHELRHADGPTDQVCVAFLYASLALLVPMLVALFVVSAGAIVGAIL
jgi:hypothetical protein